MSGLKQGDAFPEGVIFQYVAPSGDTDLTVCGISGPYDASKGISPSLPSSSPNPETNPLLPPEFKDKKVVLVAVPGAFTPTCQVSHVTSYIKNLDKLKAAGVDQVIFIASNDAWVMAAWGKANGITDDSIVRAPFLARGGESVANGW
jgi:alkyl hydroperoxide reductase 1